MTASSAFWRKALSESILLLVATQVERQAAQSALVHDKVALRMTGMGPANAAQALREELARHRPRRVLMVGLAGALSLSLRVCDVVVYTACVNETGQRLEVADSAKLLSCLTASGLRATSGVGLTLPRMLCTASEKHSFARYGVAVDMESYAVVETASRYEVPASVVRVISDDARVDLPDLASAIDSNYQPNNARMALRLMASPVLGTRFLYNLRRSLKVLTTAVKAALEGY